MNKQAKIEQLKQESRDLTKEGKIEEATKKFNEAFELQHYDQPKPKIKIRPEIMAFAEAMESEMARHDAEKGDSWKDDSFTLETAYGAMLGHFENFRRAYVKEDREAMAHEAVDNTNLWMMIFHKAKGV